MILKFKQINQDNKRLISNFFSLSTLQATNYIFPLLTIPYLVRVLGIEKFGLVTFAQVLASFFIVLTDYGFSLSATRDISVNRENRQRLNEVINTVFTTKIFLCVFSFFLFAVIIYLVPKFSEYKSLYFFSFALVAGQTFLPVWFFQGMEKMKAITYLNFISKIIFTLSIYLIIKVPSDFIYINLISGLGNFISSLLSVIFIVKTMKFNLKFSSLGNIKIQLEEGWQFFITNATIHFSLSSNLLILGLFTTSVAVGYYSVAEKVFLMVRAFASLVYQVVYPRVCKLAQGTLIEVKFFLRKILIGVIAGFLPICITLFFLADTIIYLIAGEKIYGAAMVLKILSFAPLFGALNIPASQSLLAFYHNKAYAAITSAAAIVNVILNIVLAQYWQERGTAIAALITEIFITVSLYIHIEIYYKELSLFSKFKLTSYFNLKVR